MLRRAARLRSRVSATIAAALAAVLAVSAAWLPSPARADGRPWGQGDPIVRVQGGDPAARLQVVIKSVNVSNDRDGFWTGAGDILLTAGFWRCSGPQPPCSASEDNPARLLAYARKSFNADSGDMEVLNRVMPLAPDVKDGGAASEETGIAVHAGQDYLLYFDAFERDAGGGDFMGGVQRVINASNNWGIGLHELEPAGHVADTSLPPPPPPDNFLCAGCGSVIVGDYLVTYEIRKTSLPDLHPKAVKVTDGAGGSDVCVNVENRGQQDAPPFSLALYVDNSQPPNGSRQTEGLAAGESRETCLRVNLPTSGRHQMIAIVDQGRFVPEQDEHNNTLERGLLRTPLGSTLPPLESDVATADPGPDTDSDSPSMTPDQAQPVAGAPLVADTAARPAGPRAPEVAKPGANELLPADLQVSAVEIKERAGGPCVIRGSRNTVTATIKNGGDRPSGEFAVEVKVGTQQRGKVTIGGMASNSERKIEIPNVGIAEGERTVEVIVDPDSKVTEGDEKNNSRTVEVACTVR